MKSLFKIVAVLLVVVSVVAVLGVLNLDKGLKTAIETLGPEYTKANVELASVDLSLQTGEGTLKGLMVGNPEGFKTKNAFALGEISVGVDTSTITDAVIVIDKINLLKPVITYETGADGSNLEQLIKNVTEAAEGSDSGSETTEANSNEEEVKLIIKDLQITGGKIQYNNALLGEKFIEFPLPDIRLKNLGQDSGGVTSVDVVKQIMLEINNGVASAILGAGAVKDIENQVQDQIKNKASEVGDKLKGFLKRD